MVRLNCAEKNGDSPLRWESVTDQLSIGVVKLYNDGVVQAVTFAYLIY